MHTRDRPYASVHEYRVNEPVLMRFLLVFSFQLNCFISAVFYMHVVYEILIHASFFV